jgi:hypothetical protein
VGAREQMAILATVQLLIATGDPPRRTYRELERHVKVKRPSDASIVVASLEGL